MDEICKKNVHAERQTHVAQSKKYSLARRHQHGFLRRTYFQFSFVEPIGNILHQFPHESSPRMSFPFFRGKAFGVAVLFCISNRKSSIVTIQSAKQEKCKANGTPP